MMYHKHNIEFTVDKDLSCKAKIERKISPLHFYKVTQWIDLL